VAEYPLRGAEYGGWTLPHSIVCLDEPDIRWIGTAHPDPVPGKTLNATEDDATPRTLLDSPAPPGWFPWLVARLALDGPQRMALSDVVHHLMTP
jgi:hypothetical protein